MINGVKKYWQNASIRIRLWTCISGSGLIYLAFTLPFPLTRFYAVNPPVDYAKLTRYSPFGFTAYLVGIIALFGFHLISLRLLSKENNADRYIRFVLLGGGIFALVLIFSYPQTAIDIFINAIRSRAWARYGMSPFATTPDSIPPSDQWIGLAGEWVDTASPYGPIWELLSLGAYHLSGGNFLYHLLMIKVLSALAYLGSAWLVYRILRLIHPQRALFGTAFFAWNPLILFESVQNAHNDIMMIFFLLVAVWAFVRVMQGENDKQNLLFSFFFTLAFAASILTKFVTIMVLPFFVLALALQQRTWPRRILFLAGYGLAISGLSALVMWPYWPGVENWAVLDVGSGAGRSLMAWLVLILRPTMGTNTAFDVAKGIIYSGLGIIFLWCLWQVWRQGLTKSRKGKASPEKQMKTAIWAGFTIFFGYALFGASTFHAWYALWCLSMAALLVLASRSTGASWAFSLAALLIIPYYETIRVWLPYLNQNHLLGHAIGVPLLLVPVLLALWYPLRLLPDEI